MRAARELLEEDGSAGLSLRAVARRAGVSATAPDRHYADREALEPCDPTSEERVAATAAISEYVRTTVDATCPGVDADALSTTVWALVHGLAFLHLDGKLDSSTPEIVTARVTSAVHALFNAAPAMSGEAAAAQPAV
ncbi:TetR/AcrR family transcriptional regulator [Streptomyces parvus]|uniref:TetR/AcrR family transcriptional regulator n=1 Tax=Streptomyces parvus TaxID=66428 RepID=UPI0021008DB5|nr:TetR family transcriptional regulator [Streptomyces parvus]MCQ1579055.1 TetR/AcrR family transcriptional regulator [Streptomyces parvus]